MSYDGFYSDLSTRASANDILDAVVLAKDETLVAAAEVEATAAQVALDSASATLAANSATTSAAAAANSAAEAEDVAEAAVAAGFARTLRVPASEGSVPELPGFATRANTILGFNETGVPIVVTPTSGSAIDLAIDLANATDPLKGAALVGYDNSTVADTLAAIDAAVDANTAADALFKSDLLSSAVSKGAALIGYSDSVTYGANTVGARLRNLFEYRHIESFGAVSVENGGTDSTAAVTAAIAYMNSTGRNVIIGFGTYLTDPFVINQQAYGLQANFIGIDRERSILKRRVDGAGSFVTIGSSSGTSFQAGSGSRDLTFDGGANTSGYAFEAFDLVRTEYLNCHFKGGNTALRLNGGICVTFNNCIMDGAVDGVRVQKFTSLAGGGWPNIIVFNNCQVVDNTQWGMFFNDGRMFMVNDTDVEGNGTTFNTTGGGIYCGTGIGDEVQPTNVISHGLITKDSWFESNLGLADILSEGGRLYVGGCTFQSQASQTPSDIIINGGKYVIERSDHTWTKTPNISEGASVLSNNIIADCEATNITRDVLKTVVRSGTTYQMNGGAVGAILGVTKPLEQVGTDSTGVNPTITFTTPFKTGTVPRVFMSVVNNSAGSLDAPEAYNITATGFTMRKKSHNGTSITTSNYTVVWRAIGEAT
ncbi:MAG TPA: hypothetical protein VJM50_18670 [Pyrinomonadaceae bacterium]|nr:hypothetical protein [Pyrinomonadaceae bacterium]